VLLVTLIFPVAGGSDLARLRLLFKVGVVDGSGRLGQLAHEFVSCNMAQQLSSDESDIVDTAASWCKLLASAR
jgi:hypothetical protein